MSKQDPNPNPGSRKLDRERGPEDKAESPRSRLKDEPDKKPGHESSKYYGHTDYRHLDLITRYKKDGPYRYFTVSEWNAVPSTAKSRYDKLGVVVVSEKCAPFYVELKGFGSRIDWYKAYRLYGNRLPTKAQCRALWQNFKDINACIKLFGGDDEAKCSTWGRSKNEQYAWYVDIFGGIGIDYKNKEGFVRAVAPLPNL